MINALKLARLIVLSQVDARSSSCVCRRLEAADLERLLTFLLFPDGCAEALVRAREPSGFALEGFHAEVMPAASRYIT